MKELESISDDKRESDSKDVNILQIACVYGNFSQKVSKILCDINIKHGYNIKYNIVDIAPVQLINTKNKLGNNILFLIRIFMYIWIYILYIILL